MLIYARLFQKASALKSNKDGIEAIYLQVVRVQETFVGLLGKKWGKWFACCLTTNGGFLWYSLQNR